MKKRYNDTWVEVKEEDTMFTAWGIPYTSYIDNEGNHYIDGCDDGSYVVRYDGTFENYIDWLNKEIAGDEDEF